MSAQAALKTPSMQAAPRMPRIVALTNQKGGVGKTTTAVNLATALAAVGRRVLLIDMDSQGNASTALGQPRSDRDNGSYELLFGETTLAAAARSTMVPGLDLIPSSVHLAGGEVELVTVERRTERLKEALHAQYLPYDEILIDCPPSLNMLSLNALGAADSVLVPLEPEFLPLEGLSFLMHNIEQTRRTANPELKLDGVILTKVDRRNKLSYAVENEVREHFGTKVFTTIIPRNVRIAEAPSHGMPVLIYDHRCLGSRAYIDLAKEYLERIGAR